MRHGYTTGAYFARCSDKTSDFIKNSTVVRYSPYDLDKEFRMVPTMKNIHVVMVLDEGANSVKAEVDRI